MTSAPAAPDDPARHLRLLRPAPGVLAFYDGRGTHRFAPGPNWVDDGALSLGIASYAVLSQGHALVYDTHVTLAHAARIRDWLLAEGATRFTVVLSHHHLDHIAGTAAFPGAEVIANARTLAHLTRDRQAIEGGTHQGPPAIAPLILPTRSFSGRMTLTIGTRRVDLIEANIHSDDATVIFLPDTALLLAGDTVEDSVTYVGDPAQFATHLADLDRLAALNPAAILPNHGAEAIIAAGGYAPTLIPATQSYIRWLAALRDHPDRQSQPLAEVIKAPLAAGHLTHFPGYDRVHAQNIARTLTHFHG